MAEQKTSKPTKRLFEYADNYKYLTIASWVLATVSAFIALVPFYYIWRLIKEVIRVSPDFDQGAESVCIWMVRGRICGTCHADLYGWTDMFTSCSISCAGYHAFTSDETYHVTSAWIYG